MDVRQLRYFVAVAEERHFGRAAERLHMAQPPLSQQIKQLEAELDTRLLERTTRKVELTDAGRLMLERCRQLLADLESLEHDVREVGRGTAGVLRVGFVGSATYQLMPEIVQLARQELPGVRLHVSGEMLTPQVEAGLLENRLDVAVLRPPVQSTEIHAEALEDDHLVLAVPRGHRLTRGEEPLALGDLAGEDFLAYPPSSVVATVFREACRRTGFRPRVVQEAGETSTLLAFVGAGLGIAMVPDGARTAVAAGTVAYCALQDPPGVGLAVAWRDGGRSPLLPAFRSLARCASERLATRLGRAAAVGAGPVTEEPGAAAGQPRHSTTDPHPSPEEDQ